MGGVKQEKRTKKIDKPLAKFVDLCGIQTAWMPAEYGAPQVGVALMRRASVFASGENLGAGRIHFRRAMKYLAVTKKKDTT